MVLMDQDTLDGSNGGLSGKTNFESRHNSTMSFSVLHYYICKDALIIFVLFSKKA